LKRKERVLMAESRLLESENPSQTKNRRGRPRKAGVKEVRVSFRVDWESYKRLLEKAGGKRRLSGFIRRALGVE
jgi:hypothetical protein